MENLFFEKKVWGRSFKVDLGTRELLEEIEMQRIEKKLPSEVNF